MSPKNQPAEGLNAAVAAVLRGERVAQGMTLDELALAADISKMSVRRYFAADRHIDVEVLSSMSSALGMTMLEVIQAAEQRMGRAPKADRGGNVSHLPVTPRPSDDATDLGAVASTETVIEEPGEFNT